MPACKSTVNWANLYDFDLTIPKIFCILLNIWATFLTHWWWMNLLHIYNRLLRWFLIIHSKESDNLTPKNHIPLKILFGTWDDTTSCYELMFHQGVVARAFILKSSRCDNCVAKVVTPATPVIEIDVLILEGGIIILNKFFKHFLNKGIMGWKNWFHCVENAMIVVFESCICSNRRPKISAYGPTHVTSSSVGIWPK